jgi:hypothetical protein
VPPVAQVSDVGVVISRVLRPLTPLQRRTLRWIAGHGRGFFWYRRWEGDLPEGVSARRVPNALGSLRRAGLITTEYDERGCRVWLTDDGLAVAEALPAVTPSPDTGER